MSMSSLSKAEIEVITELLSVSLGSSSAALSELFSETVTIDDTRASTKTKREFISDITITFLCSVGRIHWWNHRCTDSRHK